MAVGEARCMQEYIIFDNKTFISKNCMFVSNTILVSLRVLLLMEDNNIIKSINPKERVFMIRRG